MVSDCGGFLHSLTVLGRCLHFLSQKQLLRVGGTGANAATVSVRISSTVIVGNLHEIQSESFGMIDR